MGLLGASGEFRRPDLSIIIAIGRMPGSGVHRLVPEPSAEAMKRAFPGRPGSLTWEIGASSGPVRSQWRIPALVLKQGLDLDLGLGLDLDLEMLTEPEPMHVHRRRAEIQLHIHWSTGADPGLDFYHLRHDRRT